MPACCGGGLKLAASGAPNGNSTLAGAPERAMMAGMMLKMRLFALVALAPLAACATTAPVETAALPPAEAPPVVVEQTGPPAPDVSLVGLYLAAAAAQRDGRNEAAADYYARAAELVEEDGAPFLRERAFTAAVNAGEIEKAASLAPKPGEASQGSQRLGRMVQVVDSLAKGDAAAASAILKAEDIGQPYRNAAQMLRPWVALAAGEEDPVGRNPPPNNADRLSLAFFQANRALALEHAKRFDEADATYQALLGSGVNSRAFPLAYGAFLERQGKKAQAVAIYDRLIAEQPDDRAAVMAKTRATARRYTPPALPAGKEAASLAMAYAATGAMTQGQTGNALIYVQLALRLDPNRPEALLLAGGFAEQAGELEEARGHYAKVPAAAPEYIDARSRIAATYRDEQIAQAVAVARETARVAPNDRAAQLDLADILREAEDYEGSVKVLTKVINTKGREADWRLFYARAIALEKAGRWPEAEKDLLKALEINPDQADVMNYLGYMWADRNEKLAEAMDLLQKANRSQPNSGAIIDSLGWAYFRLGDYKKAVELLERAAELSPSDPDINDHLGDAYAKSPGRRLEALFQWERVLTLEPSDLLKAKVQGKIADEQKATSVATAAPAGQP